MVGKAAALGLALVITDELLVSPAMGVVMRLAATGHPVGLQCASPERLRFVSSGRGEDGGLRFQVRAARQ